MTAQRTFSVLLAAASITVLAACAPNVSTGGGGSSSASGDAGGTSTAGCDSYAGTEVAPFSTPLVLSAPDAGATYGDGSTLTFELDPQLADEVPQISFYDNFIAGSIRDTSSGNFEEDGNTVSINLNIFDSDLDGQPGIAEVFVITPTDYEGGVRSGAKLILGEYCVTYKVS
ncbi:hypothetical protein BH09ACT4_BH09ACT4_09640 [soil metagenome]